MVLMRLSTAYCFMYACLHEELLYEWFLRKMLRYWGNNNVLTPLAALLNASDVI